MKTLTRKSFLKILGTGASITALCALFPPLLHQLRIMISLNLNQPALFLK